MEPEENNENDNANRLGGNKKNEGNENDNNQT